MWLLNSIHRKKTQSHSPNGLQLFYILCLHHISSHAIQLFIGRYPEVPTFREIDNQKSLPARMECPSTAMSQPKSPAPVVASNLRSTLFRIKLQFVSIRNATEIFSHCQLCDYLSAQPVSNKNQPTHPSTGQPPHQFELPRSAFTKRGRRLRRQIVISINRPF